MDSSRSGQLNARMMSGRSTIRALTACESRSPRRWMSRLSGSCADGLAPDRRMSCTPSSSHRSITRLKADDDIGDRGPRPDHVVAAAVERQVRGLQCERGLELLVDDRPCELAADREVGVLDRRRRCVGPALRHQIGPAPYAAVREVVADALGERVADRDVSNGWPLPHPTAAQRSSSARPRRSRRPHAAPAATAKKTAKTTKSRGAPPRDEQDRHGQRSDDRRDPPDAGRPPRAGCPQRRRIHLGGHGVQRAPCAEIEERQRHPAADHRRLSRRGAEEDRGDRADPARKTESVSRRPQTSMSHAATA